MVKYFEINLLVYYRSKNVMTLPMTMTKGLLWFGLAYYDYDNYGIT